MGRNRSAAGGMCRRRGRGRPRRRPPGRPRGGPRAGTGSRSVGAVSALSGRAIRRSEGSGRTGIFLYRNRLISNPDVCLRSTRLLNRMARVRAAAAMLRFVSAAVLAVMCGRRAGGVATEPLSFGQPRHRKPQTPAPQRRRTGAPARSKSADKRAVPRISRVRLIPST